MADLFSTDAAGQTCVTEAGLDAIWPRDDREPIDMGKAWQMPPTCSSTLAERYTDAELLAFLDQDAPLPAIPAPPSFALLLGAVVVAMIWRKK